MLDSGNGTSNPPQLLEVMSQDLGNTSAGFDQNFAYSTLELTANTYVELVDNAANSPGDTPEALYVNDLIVPAGATLNLDGLNLYAQTEQINGTIIAGGASVSGEVYDDANDNGSLDTGETGPLGLDGRSDEYRDQLGLHHDHQRQRPVLLDRNRRGYVHPVRGLAARVRPDPTRFPGHLYHHGHVRSDGHRRGVRRLPDGVDRRRRVQRPQRRRHARKRRAGPGRLDRQSPQWLERDRRHSHNRCRRHLFLHELAPGDLHGSGRLAVRIRRLVRGQRDDHRRQRPGGHA